MTTDKALLALYAPQIKPLLALAKVAYGSRDTVSPQHDASREYTRLLVEYYEQGGSLLGMATELDVTYAGLRRRVTTANVPASSGRARKKFPPEVYEEAVKEILAAKAVGSHEYHLALKKYFDEGLSMARLATNMNLSSANPLYYGVSRVVLDQQGDSSV
jgi:hypothetical protein